MAAGTVKSENITNIEASPIVIRDKKQGELKVLIDQDAIATTSTDDVGDIMLLAAIPSNAVILDIELLNDDLDSGTALAIDAGLYYSGIGGNQVENGNTSGVVVDADCFATATTVLSGANVTYTSVRFEADDIVNIKKEAWEVAGLTEDCGGTLYIGLTVTTAATGSQVGDVVVKVSYI